MIDWRPVRSHSSVGEEYRKDFSRKVTGSNVFFLTLVTRWISQLKTSC